MGIDMWTFLGGAILGVFFTALIFEPRAVKKTTERWYTVLDVAVEREIITSDQRHRIQTIRKHYWGEF